MLVPNVPVSGPTLNDSPFFGLSVTNSNRDLSKQTTDQINTTFPVALLCYMHSENIKPNYLIVEDGELKMTTLSTEYFFGKDWSDVYFGFEVACLNPLYSRYDRALPRTDVYINRKSNPQVGYPVEMKMVVHPDSASAHLALEKQGPELVVRPDTIVHLAASLCGSSNALDNIKSVFEKRPFDVTKDWQDFEYLKDEVPAIIDDLHQIAKNSEAIQSPLVCIPIWKTANSTSDRPESFDIFFVSDAAMLEMIRQIAAPKKKFSMSRHQRSVVWLYHLFHKALTMGTFEHEKVFDEFSYATKNDKAFAINGCITNRFLACENLQNPRISSDKFHEIMSADAVRPKRIFTESVIKHFYSKS